MKVYIGADHRGFELKENLKQFLGAGGMEIINCGAREFDQTDDYPQFAQIVAQSVIGENAPTFGDDGVLGIAICGSGIGVCVAANKIAGVRAGTIWTPELATHVRQRDDINVLCLSADHTSESDAKQIAQNFLTTKFQELKRDKRRITQIMRGG